MPGLRTDSLLLPWLLWCQEEAALLTQTSSLPAWPWCRIWWKWYESSSPQLLPTHQPKNCIKKLKLGEFKSNLANSWRLSLKQRSSAAQRGQAPHPCTFPYFFFKRWQGHRFLVLGPTHFNFCVYTVNDHLFHMFVKGNCSHWIEGLVLLSDIKFHSQGRGTLGCQDN